MTEVAVRPLPEVDSTHCPDALSTDWTVNTKYDHSLCPGISVQRTVTHFHRDTQPAESPSWREEDYRRADESPRARSPQNLRYPDEDTAQSGAGTKHMTRLCFSSLHLSLGLALSPPLSQACHGRGKDDRACASFHHQRVHHTNPNFQLLN